MLLQNMRDKAQGWVAKVIVAAIAFTFAIFGLESLRPSTTKQDVAFVDGEAITQQQLLEAMDQQRRMLVQQMGSNFDAAALNDPMLKTAAMESLVQRTLLRIRLKKNNMVVSDDMVDELILSVPEFQVDGQYDPERVRQYVRSAGMNIAQFRNMLREDMVATQLRAGVAATEFVTSHELRHLNSLQGQTRDLSWLILDGKKVRDAVTVSDEDVAAYYNEQSASFMQPEQVSVDYIVLDKSKLAATIEVTDSDVSTLYDARVVELKSKAKAELRASMILLEPDDQRDQAATMALAKQLSDELKAGADFAALAGKHSDDTDSSAKGGSLGIVETGFFGDAFDSALAALQPGEISAPVEADFGVVVIRRDAAGEARIPTREQMSASLKRELREQAVEPLFFEKSRQLADISFEASDLTQPAETLGLEIQQTDLFSRDGGKGIAANPRVVAAAFSEEVLDMRTNSDLIDFDANQFVVLHRREHKKPEQKALESVKDEIAQILRTERGDKQLLSQAEALVSELVKGAEKQKVADDNGLAWDQKEKAQRFGVEISALLRAKAFRLPHPAEGKSSFGTAVLENGDVAVIQVTNVVPGSSALLDEAQMRILGANLALRNGSQIFDEYVRNLRETAKIEVVRQGDEG